ncbi:MAG: hypothetical protein GU346_06275 [Thermocrinis sp.]|jgi:hypothetical protein|nr:hypothetical protein [Thermocrinis sp.]
MRECKTQVLKPKAAIAFTEKGWKRWRGLAIEKGIKLLHYGANEYFMCVPVINAPFAKVVVITVDEVYLTEDDKRAVVEALRKSRAFMSLMKRRNIPVARLMWAYSSEFDEVRDRKYPVFYVVLNDSNSPIEVPLLSGNTKTVG